MQSDGLNTREDNQNHTSYHRIREFEVKEALKWIENGKEIGPDSISIKVWKCRREDYKLDHKIV